MTGLHDHGYALRLQDLSDRERHLLRQPLLDLESTGEHLCEACQFGETQYSSIWDIAYVHLSSEGYHMMLAQREDLDIFNNDKLIVIFMKDSSVDQITDVFLIAFSKVKHGFCIALRRPSQALSVWIFSYTFQNGGYSSFQFL